MPTSNITYKEVHDPKGPSYWVAEQDGKVIAKSMSEAGVRTIVLTIANKKKNAEGK